MEGNKNIIKERLDRLRPYIDPSKDKPEKFMASLLVVNDENIDIAIKYNLKLKPSVWSVLSIDPMLFEKTLVRASELGFIDAYTQNAANLKQDVDVVIKRMSELDHLGIPYKNEKGKYSSSPFSLRGFNYVKSLKVKEEKKNNELTIDYDLKELADRLIENYNVSDKDGIYQRLRGMQDEDLSVKEVLMELFKEYDPNLDNLNNNIEELMNGLQETKGRVA